MADRQLFDRPDAAHRFHDLLLIAAYAAGDVTDTDRVRARALVDACHECASLVADIELISRATPMLPTPTRPRDFRLTQADAERLRPHGFRRVAAAFDARRLQLARPLATGLTMLGLAGVLITTVPSFSAGGNAASAPGVTGSGAEATDSRLEQLNASLQPAAESFNPDGAVPMGTGDDFQERDVTPGPGSSLAAGGVPPTGGFSDAGNPDPGVPAAGLPADAAASVDVIRLLSVVALALGLGLLLVSTLVTRRRRT